ncbi:aspartic peptidase a1 [Moniliophthora roreri MCA 2997]|uniref:Aspartic peptidase a1 n=1 Tax=Moniliophthora roreri (strain MCA 2997) TaxID=1381753 RepID=V2XD95_MONRO|nr:aspartic peptidase a1 [Moniliophthora roreri MCA 2997]
MPSTVSFKSSLSPMAKDADLQPVVGNHMKHIVNRDRARAQKLMKRSTDIKHHLRQPARTLSTLQTVVSVSGTCMRVISISDSSSSSAVTYVMPVAIGNPATTYNLLIDTGSSNTWVGANKEYKPSKQSQTERKEVSVTYGSGSFIGTEYTDCVALSDNLMIEEQSIGIARETKGFGNDGIDGILGIGPVDLTHGTVQGMESVPTVTDSLLKQGTIQTESIGIFYAPTTGESLPNGEMTFGGVDETKTTTSIKYVPITKTSPACQYWGVDQVIKYDGQQILNNCAGIVDTGTTLIMLATDCFEKYMKMTGAVMDDATGLLTVTKEQFKNMKSMMFHIGDMSCELTPNAQIWPRKMNTMFGGQTDKIYLVFADMGQPSGTGLDFINGFTFLQRFYSVYDTTNSQIGFAETKFTKAITN